MMSFDFDEARRELQLMTPRQAKFIAGYFGECRDIAARYQQTHVADVWNELAILAAEVSESQLRLADAVDDAVNPFQPLDE